MRCALLVAILIGSGLFPVWGLTAEQEAKLLASDGEEGDEFGIGVALDGDTALIGAYFDKTVGPNPSGSVYVFVRNGGVWTEQAKLVPSDAWSVDRFGFAVALDGDTALIGSYWDDDNGLLSGSAYVFTRTGEVWTEHAKLLPADGATGHNFGKSVAIEGETAIIGASKDPTNGENAGSAYVFTRTAGVWAESAKLLPSDPEAWDYFGESVALAGDYALVGAIDDDPAGAVYVFKHTGGAWTEETKLLPSDPDYGQRFGGRLAFDGQTAVIGAHWYDGSAQSSGGAYVFTRSGSTWTEQAQLLASDGAANDEFGRSVALSGDTVVIGAIDDGDLGDHSGSAYVFTRDEGQWTEQAKILASDGAYGDHFGVSAALDGDIALVGANRDDDNGNGSGSVYAFRLLPDENVPAVGYPGIALLLLVLLATGLYFMRGRAAN